MNVAKMLEEIDRDLALTEDSIREKDLVDAHMKVVNARSRLKTLIDFVCDLRSRAYELYGDL